MHRSTHCCALAWPAAGSTGFQTTGRWPTGNRRLAPPTLAGGQVLYAGDATLGQLAAACAKFIEGWAG